MRCRLLIWLLMLNAAALLLVCPCWPQGGGRGPSREVVLPADSQPPLALSAVAGRPTDRSVAINVICARGGQALVEYGTATGQYAQRAAPVVCVANTPVEAVLTGLQQDTAYCYRVRVGDQQTPELGFHTARAPGSTFTFEIHGDSHPERPQMFDPSLYAHTLRAAAADRPDFYMAIGDDFSVDTLPTVTAEAVDRIYRTQRLFLSLVGVPLFLVNGNHEQAALCHLDGTANNVAVWVGNARNRHFPLPAPNDFYTGNATTVEHVGLLRDYYAWTWGDALFAVVDPYWHSREPVDNVRGGREKGTRDPWDVTLGEAQYQWFRQTLQQSRAKFKFVFAHHVNGTGRRGIEGAGLGEWGGRDRNGAWLFEQKRPGWEAPIHQLMAKAGVTVFFQGHDHIFAKQQLDGVIYQSLPLPGDPYYTLHNREAYHSGDALPGSGRLRVTVSPEKVSVAYVRSYLPRDETSDNKSEGVPYSYDLPVPH